MQIAAGMLFVSIFEVHEASIAAAKKGYYKSLGTLARSNMESQADAKWIFGDRSKADDRSARYILAAYDLIRNAKAILEKQGTDLRSSYLRGYGEWTTSTIEDRIQNLSGNSVQYDFLSYFAHTNPSYIMMQHAWTSDHLLKWETVFVLGALLYIEVGGVFTEAEIRKLNQFREECMAS